MSRGCSSQSSGGGCEEPLMLLLRERTGFTVNSGPVSSGDGTAGTPGAGKTAVLTKDVSKVVTLWGAFVKGHLQEQHWTSVSDTPRNGDHKRRKPECGEFYFI